MHELTNMIIDCSRGLNHLHLNAIIHLDFKDGNTLVFTDSNGKRIYKVADIGGSPMFENKLMDFM